MHIVDKQIKESFLLADINFDGHISSNELLYALRFLGVESDYSLMENKSGANYSMNDYVKIAKKHLGPHTPKERITNSLKKMDKNNNGSISVDALVHLVITMSDILTENDYRRFKKFVDPESKNIIPLHVFVEKILS
ncbi:putative calmodulin [Plasmodium gaboni]|uniref:Calmodulin, putative n=1 Tax=Plasmodium gaboni TaxID=647221 RepID=A0A151L9Z9_9APIC|nr:putative calmodulin [Plasmodium gaboni]KYN95794.1 putative calmodulin [Plasmodium gaboni]SOV18831.1 calmodulin, putative [Plasmodium gaboni]SOV24924.1 calmodulin, putative [Plasmodium sp. DRC-Itaito]